VFDPEIDSVTSMTLDKAGKTPKKNCVSVFLPLARSMINTPSQKSTWVFSAGL
jgi:hypothetical protein